MRIDFAHDSPCWTQGKQRIVVCMYVADSWFCTFSMASVHGELSGAPSGVKRPKHLTRQHLTFTVPRRSSYDDSINECRDHSSSTSGVRAALAGPVLCQALVSRQL